MKKAISPVTRLGHILEYLFMVGADYEASDIVYDALFKICCAEVTGKPLISVPSRKEE